MRAAHAVLMAGIDREEVASMIEAHEHGLSSDELPEPEHTMVVTVSLSLFYCPTLP